MGEKKILNRKLSDIKGEEAIDVLADILEPVTAIMADEQVRNAVNAKLPTIKIVQLALKTHKKDIVKILAVMDGQDAENYEVNLLELPARILEILNDETIMSLFTSQGQMMESERSGSAVENTEGK